MKRFLRTVCWAQLILLLAASAHAQESSLFPQSATVALEQRFGNSNLSWLLLGRSGQILAEHWLDSNASVPPGSLLKPFVALAYGEQHSFVYPRVHCHGIQGRCWRPGGHGTPGLESALAGSCNDYFLALAGDLDYERARSTFVRLGLTEAPRAPTPAMLIGLENGWDQAPLAIARAYLALLDEPDAIRGRLLEGMAAAASSGTASAVDAALGDRAALAKTGTARCTHRPRASADGFAVVLYPADQPRLLLLLRMHGATGAATSAQAAAMLRSLGMGIR